MKNESTNKGTPFPTRLLTGALVLTVAMLVALVWSGVDSYRNIATVQLRDLRIEELRGTIVHLDEVLTMSARMAAATGDSDWERRYRQFEPQLDAAIKKAMELTAHSDSAQAAAQTDAANLKLVEMENQGLALVRAGESGRAKAVLFSDAYEAQKKIYAGGMVKLIQHLKEQLTANQRQKQREAFLSIIAVACCIVLFLFTWLGVLRKLNCWRTMQSASLDALTRAEEALRQFNDGLEKRVEDRTRSLELEIRERKDAEAALLGSDEKFHQLADNITDVFWIRSPDLREVHYISPAFERIWGRSMESLYANPQQWADAILPEDRERVLAVFATLTGAAPNVSIEYRIARPDGEVRWVHARGFQVRDAADELIRLTGIVTDITERKQMEEQLRKLSCAVEQSPASIIITNTAGEIEYVNPKFTQVTGYGLDEVRGKNPRVLKSSETPAGEYQRMWKTITQGGEWHGEFHNRKKNGELYWEAASLSPIWDDTGKITHFLAVKEDITERKQAEISALAFSKLGQNLGAAASPEEAARTISEVADNLLGWDSCWVQLYSEKDDLIYSIFNTDMIDGKRVSISPITARKPTEMHRRIMSSGAELILRDEPTSVLPGATAFGDKSRPSASIMFVPIRSRSRTVGILSVQSYASKAYNSQSLTALQILADQCGGTLERIWAGEDLRKSESQFRLVWNASADGMRLADSDGTVVMVNDAYCQMVEKSKEEVEGKPLSIIQCKENQEHILRKHREQIANKSSRLHLEKEVTLWNGKKVWFGLSNSILELPGQPPLLLSVFRDITQRKQAETDLDAMHRQLLDASRQAGMADVATNVLHNVGNVLNSVNVSGSVIREKVKKSKGANLGKVVGLLQDHGNDLSGFFANDPKAKQLPGYLAQLAAHLAGEQEELLREVGSLVNNIEHIKEIVAMQQSYAKVSGVSESLQLVDLVEDALRMNAGALDRHQVQVVREYSNVPPITTEKHKVLQILVNLVRNAKYACDDANQTHKQVTVRVTDGDNKLRVSVIDNGIGIPPENLTRIFAHGFTTRKNGHGFGLHSGALAAKEIGGSLNVRSGGLGQGAEFTLELPLQS